MSETVWVAERVAVYGQGVVAVLTSRAAAEQFANTVRPDSDGHHNWRFTELPLGVAPPALPPPEIRKRWLNQDRLTAPEDVDTGGSVYLARDRDEWIPLD